MSSGWWSLVVRRLCSLTATDPVPYEVYVLECADGTLYTGIARDAAARLAVHNSGRGAKYTRSRLPVTLRYRETQPDKGAALRRELEIKGMTRAEKLKLIECYNKKDEA